MTDIAPLGFAIDTGNLMKGKEALDQVTKAGHGTAAAIDKVTKANLEALRAEKDAAEATAKHANAKLNLLKATDNVKASAIQEAKALADGANAAAAAARAKYELAKAGGSVDEALKGVTKSGGIAAGVMQGVAREGAALASQMGMGSMGGRLGVAGALGAAQGAAGRLTPALSVLQTGMGRLGIGVGAVTAGYVALTAALADNQDKFASYEQQLVNSLGSQSAAQMGLYKVVDLANEVGISVDAALQSFNRFARAKDAIGATDEQLLKMTETIMKIGRAGGVEAGSMQAAMMQLSQSLGSGRLNGDELRSVMENMQPLAKAIADGLGVSIGQLRRMGAEGELTGDKVFEALLKQGKKADEMFATMPHTVEQSKARMANQFDELSAHIGKLIHASEFQRFFFDMLSVPVDAINKKFREVAEDGLSSIEKKTRELEARQASLQGKTRPFTDEVNKEFNKDTARERELQQRVKDIQDNINKTRDLITITQQLYAIENKNLEKRQGDLNRLRGLAGSASPTVAKSAKEQINEINSAAETQRINLEKFKQQLADLEAGAAGAQRALTALHSNDPFEKIGQEIDDLKWALDGATGGMVQMRLEAVNISRETGKSVEEVIRLMAELERLKTQQELQGKEFSAKTQTQLAQQLAGGANKDTAEAAAEAAEWAFQKFGNTMDQNTDIVQRYTAALIQLKQATQAVADATELTRLKNQIEELRGTMGLGGYDERAARQQIGIQQFQRERAGGAVVPTQAGGAGQTSSEAFINAIMWAESRGRNWQAPGQPLASPAGALFAMQVMPGTAARPGYGIAPARSRTPEEYNRVGQELAKALLAQYGDPGTAAAAYHSGPGNLGHLGPAGRAYVQTVTSRLGIAAGGAGMPGVDLTGQVVAGRNDLFNMQEQARAANVLRDLETRRADAADRGLAAGDPEAIRQLELEIKVREAIKDVAPAYREEVANAIKDADAAERIAAAKERIAQTRQDNDNQARRNQALATGSPQQIRALELELQIEQIRRTAPKGQQSGLIAEARRGSALQLGEGIARMSGELQKQVFQLKLQEDLVGKIGDEERIQVKLNEAKVQLFMLGADLTSETSLGILAQVEAVERMNIALEKTLSNWRAIQDTGRETAEKVGHAFGDFFATMTRTGELKWKDMMGAIEEAFYSALDRMVEQFVISPLVNLLTQGLQAGLGALFGGAPASGGLIPGIPVPQGINFSGGWANGGVFAGGVTPFAGGGIFNTPTPFMFGGGRRGLAGEGPNIYEAIVPLKRGANGQLGIQAGGGGSTGKTEVNVYDMRAAGNSEAVEIEERQTGDGMRQVNVMVRDAVRGHINKGSFDSDMRSNFGNRRTVQRR